MNKFLLAFIIFFTVLFYAAFYFVIPNVKEVAVQEESKEVELNIARYLHGWNMSAYFNGSMISFKSNINSEGDYVFTAVNVEVDKYEDEHIELIAIISKQWFDITDSRIVHFINTEGVVAMWTDKQGIVQSLLKKSKNA